MAFADINGANLFYTDEGEGLPVLLVHGSTCDSFDWNYQLSALDGKYRVIAVDRRGHGHSSAPEGSYSAHQDADDLAALLEHVGAERVVAVGHSTGGTVVASLAARYPGRVRAIVPIGIACCMPLLRPTRYGCQHCR